MKAHGLSVYACGGKLAGLEGGGIHRQAQQLLLAQLLHCWTGVHSCACQGMQPAVRHCSVTVCGTAAMTAARHHLAADGAAVGALYPQDQVIAGGRGER